MMEHTLHYHLLAAHTLFQKLFLYRVNREYPDLLPGQPKVMDFLMSRPRSFQREIAEGRESCGFTLRRRFPRA